MLDNTFNSGHSGLLPHGGELQVAAQRYAIPLENWLDLSTGINPDGWSPPRLPAPVWSRLPETDDGLEDAARDYYQAMHLLPTAGSQAAILALPRLRAPGRVGVIDPGYGEHALAWKRAGHRVEPVAPEQIDHCISRFDVMVLARPNNPTGHCPSTEQILYWHEQLAARDGWLVVDEAFMDPTPEHSIIPQSGRPGMITLRSLGKFFGLAGARVGFVFAHPAVLNALQAELGPWTVCSAARHIAKNALLDFSWQQQCRNRLPVHSTRLQHLLKAHHLPPTGSCALFHWCIHERAEIIHTELATRGILTRLFSTPQSLRFGLPASEADWQRLASALAEVTR